MEPTNLKKKLSTYLTEGGYLKNVPEDILCEFLTAWQDWPGSSKEFYASLGFSHRKMATLLGKAKKLKREGHFGSDAFKEVKVSEEVTEDRSIRKPGECRFIELQTKKGQIIRFPKLSQLMEFLEKAG